MTTLTTSEAALMVGVQPATVRQWVRRGFLHPTNAATFGSMYFYESEVARCAYERKSKRDHERHEERAKLWRVVTGQT